MGRVREHIHNTRRFKPEAMLCHQFACIACQSDRVTTHINQALHSGRGYRGQYSGRPAPRWVQQDFIEVTGNLREHDTVRRQVRCPEVYIVEIIQPCIVPGQRNQLCVPFQSKDCSRIPCQREGKISQPTKKVQNRVVTLYRPR